MCESVRGSKSGQNETEIINYRKKRNMRRKSGKVRGESLIEKTRFTKGGAGSVGVGWRQHGGKLGEDQLRMNSQNCYGRDAMGQMR